MMYTQVIQYKKYLLFTVFYQPAHEIDQLFRIHAVLVQHKVQLASF